MTLQPNGKIVVVGDTNVTFFNYDAVVLRFLGNSLVQHHF